MKNLLIVLGIFFGFSLVTVSCGGDDASNEDTTEAAADGEDHKCDKEGCDKEGCDGKCKESCKKDGKCEGKCADKCGEGKCADMKCGEGKCSEGHTEEGHCGTDAANDTTATCGGGDAADEVPAEEVH